MMNNTETKPMTREDWLMAAIEELAPLYTAAGVERRPIRVSVGFPISGARPSRKQTVGECWYPETTADNTPQIFIHPQIADGVEALDTLAHELVHAYGGRGHKGEFRRAALAIGLTGKMTSTVAGPELRAKLEALVAKLGTYPHASLNVSARKKQSTRLLKATCPMGYTIRLTAKWADIGLPTCPCCGVTFTLAGAVEDAADEE